jgi:hypothetical protein
MPYYVDLPDGQRVEVPDDVSQAEARSVILKAFPQFNTAEAQGRSTLQRNVLDPLERGYQQTMQGVAGTRGLAPESWYGLPEAEAATAVAERQRRLEQIPQTRASQEAFRKAQEATSLLGSVAAIGSSASAVGDIGLESIGSNPVAGGLGVVENLIPIPFVRQVVGALAGAAGFPTEFANSHGQAILQSVRDAGLDPSKPEDVRTIIGRINADPATREKIRTDAFLRAGIISGTDAVVGYGAGRLATRSALPRIAGGAAMEGAGGALGEAGAQLATEGKLNNAEIAAEFIGGGVGGAIGNVNRAVSAEERRQAEDELKDQQLRAAFGELGQQRIVVQPPEREPIQYNDPDEARAFLTARFPNLTSLQQMPDDDILQRANDIQGQLHLRTLQAEEASKISDQLKPQNIQSTLLDQGMVGNFTPQELASVMGVENVGAVSQTLRAEAKKPDGVVEYDKPTKSYRLRVPEAGVQQQPAEAPTAAPEAQAPTDTTQPAGTPEAPPEATTEPATETPVPASPAPAAVVVPTFEQARVAAGDHRLLVDAIEEAAGRSPAPWDSLSDEEKAKTISLIDERNAEVGFDDREADDQSSSRSVRLAQKAAEPKPIYSVPTTEEDAVRQQARKVVDQRLEKLRKLGTQGNKAADGVVAAIERGDSTPEQLYEAFHAADIIANLLPQGANHQINFLNTISANVQGNRAAPQAEGMDGIINLSLAENQLPLLRETAAHEAFHVLQDYYAKYDPEFSKLLARDFKKGMKVSELPESIQKALNSHRIPGGTQTYFDFLKDNPYNAKDMPVSEIQAYVFGSLLDMSKRGIPITTVQPAYRRFINFLKSFFKKMGDDIKAEGPDSLSALQKVVRGETKKFDSEVSPVGQGEVQQSARGVLERIPELEAKAKGIKEGTVTREEYAKAVDALKPVKPYDKTPQPATFAEMKSALTKDKVDRIGVPSLVLKEGDPVGLRLDIPAYADHGVWVVSVHEQKSGFGAGPSIGYEGVAAVSNPTFGVVENAALNIAAGKPKATIATVKGSWLPMNHRGAEEVANKALNSDSWAQVGMDPTRHSYFYDRKTMRPIVSADMAIQIGPLVLAKNPVYGDVSKFQFSARTPLASSTTWQSNTQNMTAGRAPRSLGAVATEKVFGAQPSQVAGAVGAKAKASLAARSFKQNVINIAAPVYTLDKMLRDAGLRTVRNLGHLVETARMNTGRIELVRDHGGLVWNNAALALEFTNQIPSMKKALVGRVRAGDMKEFQQYLIALRERDLRRSGKKGLSSKTDPQITDVIREAERVEPNWRLAADDIQRINKGMLDLAVATGIMDRATANRLAGIFYTPFFRYVDVDATNATQDVIGPNLSNTLSNPDAFEKAVHAGQEVGDDLIDNMLRNYDAIIRSAMKNVAAREVAKGMMLLNNGAGQPMAQRLQGRQSGGNIITTKENGKDVRYRINEPDIYLALVGLPKEQRGALFSAAAKIANIFRIGITSAPSYIWANIWRGKVVGYPQEGLPLWSNTFGGMKQFYQASTSLTSFQASTGFGGFTMGMGDKAASSGFMREFRSANGERTFGDIFPNLIAGIQKFSEASEMADRIKLREHLMRKGMNAADAEFQAYLMAPYSRHGLGGGFLGSMMSTLTPLVPFLNSKIQSVNRMFENEKNKKTLLGIPVDRIMRSLLITSFSVGLYAMSRATDPDRWDDETDDTITRYDVAYVGGSRILIPRAFEYGLFFGAIPIFALEAIRKDETDQLVGAVIKAFTSTFGFAPIPKAVAPILEVATGMDLFRQQPLETRAQRNLPVEERVNERTSSVARLASQGITSAQSILPPEVRVELSPISIQHLIGGYTGSIGTMLLAAMDSMLAGAGVIEGKPSNSIFGDPSSAAGAAGALYEISGASRFVRPQDEQVTRSLQDFYRMKEQLDQLVRSHSLAEEVGDYEKADQLMDRHGEAIDSRRELNRYQSNISKLTKEMQMIRSTPGAQMSGDEKRQRLNELIDERNILAREAAQVAREIGLR